MKFVFNLLYKYLVSFIVCIYFLFVDISYACPFPHKPRFEDSFLSPNSAFDSDSRNASIVDEMSDMYDRMSGPAVFKRLGPQLRKSIIEMLMPAMGYFMEEALKVGAETYKVKINGRYGEKKTIKIRAKILKTGNMLPYGVNAWLAGEGTDTSGEYLIIVARSVPGEEIEFLSEMLFHEWRELFWIKKGLYITDAHKLASAEQALAFSKGDNLTPYHRNQVEDMSMEGLEEIRDEYKSRDRERYHYRLFEKYFGAETVREIREYERIVFEKADSILNVKRRYEQKKNGKANGKRRLTAKRMSDARLRTGLARCTEKELCALYEKAGKIEDCRIEDKEKLESVLLKWLYPAQLEEILQISKKSVIDRRNAGDIRSWICVNGYTYYHPKKAVLEYRDYLKKKKRIKRERRRKTVLLKGLRKFSRKSLCCLMKKVSKVEGKEIKSSARLQSVLAGWITVEQLADIFGIGGTAVRGRVQAKDIVSFVKAGKLLLLHSVKATEEYRVYEENRRDIAKGRVFKTSIQSMTPEKIRELSEFIERETGLKSETADELVIYCSGCDTLKALAGYLKMDKKRVAEIIKYFGINTFRVESDGGRTYVLIAPKGLERIKTGLREYFDRIQAWHKEVFGEEITISSFKDLESWVRLEDLKGVFPFLGEYSFENSKYINAFKSEKGLSNGWYIVPPLEAERLKDEAVSWIKNPRAFQNAKKYGLIPEGLEPEELDYEPAKTVIVRIKKNWLTIHEFAELTGKGRDEIRGSIRRGVLDYIKLGLFSVDGMYFIPPECVQIIEEENQKEIEKAKGFLRERCEADVPADCTEKRLRELLEEYCVTDSFVEEKTSVKRQNFKNLPYRVHIRLPGESFPTAYWSRKDAEYFIRQEERKFIALMTEVSCFSDVSHITNARGLVDFLEQNWLSAEEYCMRYGINYSVLMNKVWKKKIFYVKVTFFGFKIKVYFPPDMKPQDERENVPPPIEEEALSSRIIGGKA